MLPIHRFTVLVLLATALSTHAQKPDAPPAAPANSALDGELFYELLLGELNAQGGEPATGFSLILDAARKTNDPKLYQRAVDIALQARSGESALQAARTWKQALPGSRQANHYVLQILVGLNRIGETLEPLKREIKLTDAKNRATVIAAIPRYFTHATDKKLAASIVEQALAEQLSQAATGVAAWITVGRMRMDAADIPGALEAAHQAQALDPRAEGPALLALALMSPKIPQAEPIVRKYLEGKPQPDIRMAYARALLDAQRYAEAQVQLQIITSTNPDYALAWLVQGTLELQDNKLVAAEKDLKRYVELTLAKHAGPPSAAQDRGLVQAYLSLAQIAEQRKDLTQAEAWLKRIDSAEDMISAQTRRAAILAHQGKLDAARKLIRNLPEHNPADARMKLVAEVQLLRDNKHYKTAYDLLAEALSRNPKDVDLLYDQAMLADKLGKPDEMERLLRQLIAIKPEYHHAYNALGYSLAERNTRLAEARQLVLKALAYAPDDPFITDSLGWVEFRSGNKEEALRILQRAFTAKPDAEIAAHLGEVLWSMDKREQATSIWRQGLQLNAESETLLETLKRLRVKL